ncbi:universal stress protein [Streptomyces aureocirculatus]|uniref:universal stress protein n=1 Tax=Streptomyces aureocirculatus TaxID=67275 RepID=UPI0004C8B5D5|nr:universal stress protein [Streptomyces aureocirculatus]
MVTQAGERRRIVVGVDGSPPSRAALRWAVRQARVTSSVVESLIAWDYPTTAGWPPLPLPDDFESTFGKTLSEAVAQVTKDEPGVEIRQAVIDGNAAKALITAAQGADLLVVGNRGHGAFTQALLGSVSQHCVHLAPCPVVVVRV